MNFKRTLEGSELSDRVPKRRLAPSSSLLRNANSFPQDLENRIVALFRGVLREELPRILPIFMGLSSTSRILNNPIQRNGGEAADLRLQFITNIPETVFTGNKIQAPRVLIELIHSRNGTRVTTGSLSSLKIEIVALEGDFDPDDTSNFNEKIVVERQGRRPILNGDLTSVTLTQGLGCLDNVVLTDNSRWIRCGKFRLGARVSSKSRVGERVHEGSSNAFKVKDNRGLVYEKHRPPYPKDEVWRLDKIAKGGKYCVRLAHKEIRTVKDFLRVQETNPSLLKKILGGKGTEISDRTWETIIGHAADCKIDVNEMFTYSSPGLPNIELMFDQVYRLKGATFDGHKCCPVETLTGSQTILVQNLKQQAFKNLNLLTPVKGPPLDLGPPRELANLAADRFLAQQDMSETLFGSTSASTFCYEAPGSHYSEVSGPQIYYPDYVISPTAIGNFTSVDDNTCLHGATNFGPSTSSADQNGPQFHESNSLPMLDNLLSLDELGNFSSFASSCTFSTGPSGEAGPSYSTLRSRVAWLKIRATYKWGSVRRNIAARRNLAAMGQQVSCLLDSLNIP